MSSVERTLAIVQLFALRLGLRPRLACASLDGLLRRLGERPAPLTLGALSLGELGEAIDWAERAVEWVPYVGKSCLYRCLGRFGLLRSWGYRPAFVMGVDPRRPEQAHAWLELDGVPFRETLVRELVVSFRFPSEPAARC